MNFSKSLSISNDLNNFLMDYTYPFKKLPYDIYLNISSYLGKFSNDSYEIENYCYNLKIKKEKYYLKLDYINFVIKESKYNLNFDILTNIFSFVGNLDIYSKILDIGYFNAQ